jgi:hypothetical protein
MKHVSESLSQYYDYKFFNLLEEKEETADLKSKEKDGLAVIDKIVKNFEDFKKAANDEIGKYKAFWEENKKAKEGFSESGEVYKLYDNDYVVGVMELPAETLSDGSIEGGLGATEDQDEEIIEGKAIGEDDEELSEGDDSEQISEAEESEDDLDLDLAAPESEEKDVENTEDTTNDLDLDLGDSPEGETTEPEADSTEPVSDVDTGIEPSASDNLSSEQTYFVVYSTAGEEREEIFRCGSNNVVNAFKEFYNDKFKGAMKDIILKYKEQKEEQKKVAEKSEKKKVEKSKETKLQKFLKDK